MRFGITRLHPKADSFIELTAESFALAKSSKAGFMALREIEEKLDILLENYAEYERELLSLTLQRSLFFDPSWSSVVSDIHLVNRRLANLLTTGRLYVDQVRHEIKAVYGAESLATKALREGLQYEYSRSLGYRVMEELRNYIQHRALPVWRIDYPNKTMLSDSIEGERRITAIRWAVTPSLSVDALRGDRKIKRSVLDELASIGEYVPVTPLVRQYVEGIGRFHEKLREVTSKDLAEWKGQMEHIIEQGRQCFHKDLIGVSLVAEDRPGNFIESEQVFDDLLKRHAFLARKNLILKGISIQFVTSECIEKEE